MLPDEFLDTYLLSNFSNYLQKSSKYVPSTNLFVSLTKRSVLTVPSRVDWREKNVVTKVENQHSCGACYAFTAVEVIESQYAIKTGILEKLSIQEMIDCSLHNDGCSGGDVYTLLDWMRTENVSVAKEEEYPLVLIDQKCKHMSIDGIRIKDFKCNK